VAENRQLLLYAIGLQDHYGVSASEMQLCWDYVEGGGRVYADATPAHIEQGTEEAVETIRQIEAAEDYPPTRNRWCNWCSYQKICPAFWQ
jgi:RecB family exonuclease